MAKPTNLNSPQRSKAVGTKATAKRMGAEVPLPGLNNGPQKKVRSTLDKLEATNDKSNYIVGTKTWLEYSTNRPALRVIVTDTKNNNGRLIFQVLDENACQAFDEGRYFPATKFKDTKPRGMNLRQGPFNIGDWVWVDDTYPQRGIIEDRIYRKGEGWKYRISKLPAENRIPDPRFENKTPLVSEETKIEDEKTGDMVKALKIFEPPKETPKQRQVALHSDGTMEIEKEEKPRLRILFDMGKWFEEVNLVNLAEEDPIPTITDGRH